MDSSAVDNLVEILDFFTQLANKEMTLLGMIHPTPIACPDNSVEVLHLVPKGGVMHQAVRRAVIGIGGPADFRRFDDFHRVIVVMPCHLNMLYHVTRKYGIRLGLVGRQDLNRPADTPRIARSRMVCLLKEIVKEFWHGKEDDVLESVGLSQIEQYEVIYVSARHQRRMAANAAPVLMLVVPRDMRLGESVNDILQR